MLLWLMSKRDAALNPEDVFFWAYWCFKTAEKLMKLKDRRFFTKWKANYVNLYIIQYIKPIESGK